MKLDPSQLIAVVDSREQKPFNLSPMQMAEAGLATGDYSIWGLEDQVCLERKSLDDLVSCVGSGRERFKRELQRMKAYPARCVVVESDWGEITSGRYKSQLHPESALNTIATWMGQYSVPFMFAGDRNSAQKFAGRFLFHAARKWFDQMEGFMAALPSRK